MGKMNEDYKKGFKKARFMVNLVTNKPIYMIRNIINEGHKADSKKITVFKTDYAFAERKDWDVQLKIFSPEGANNLPVVLFIHGGGFIFGQNNEIIARALCNNCSCISVFIDYRLSPEYKFPVPLEDCYAAAVWVHDNINKYGGNSEKIIISGESAGGSIAAGVLMLLKQRGGFKIKGQVLMYPFIDFYKNIKDNPYRSFRKNEKYLLTNKFAHLAADSYLRNDNDYLEPLIFCLKAESLSYFPRTLLISSELDILADTGKVLYEKLKKEKVEAEFVLGEGMLHAFMEKLHLQQVKQIYSSIKDFIKEG